MGTKLFIATVSLFVTSSLTTMSVGPAGARGRCLKLRDGETCQPASELSAVEEKKEEQKDE